MSIPWQMQMVTFFWSMYRGSICYDGSASHDVSMQSATTDAHVAMFFMGHGMHLMSWLDTEPELKLEHSVTIAFGLRTGYKRTDTIMLYHWGGPDSFGPCSQNKLAKDMIPHLQEWSWWNVARCPRQLTIPSLPRRDHHGSPASLTWWRLTGLCIDPLHPVRSDFPGSQRLSWW